MILQTMNDEEKAYELIRATNWLCNICDDVHKKVIEKFKKGTRFPYFQRYCATDDKNNHWTILFYCRSKAMKKSKAYGVLAYITYDVPRKQKENYGNAGKGLMFFDPLCMRDMINGKEVKRPTAVFDIVPHAFNRYTQRYLKPKYLDSMEFAKKFENMLTRWQWFDVAADLFGDKNAKKHADDGLCPYDVVMNGGGLLRGSIINNLLVRFYTYIDKDSMFNDQIERYDEMISEYSHLKRMGEI